LDAGYKPAVTEWDQRIAPGNDNNDNYKKPLLLYLPGFDGTTLSPFIQFPELSTIFDVRAMEVDMSDRSSFDYLKNVVLDYLKEQTTQSSRSTELYNISEEESANDERMSARKKNRNVFSSIANSFTTISTTNPSSKTKRQVYLMGESFGGMLATAIAMNVTQSLPNTNTNNNDWDLAGLLLINPATCYDRCKLASEGPLVAEIPSLLYPMALLAKLVPLFTDEYSFPQLLLILRSKGLPSIIDTPAREAYMGRVAFSLPSRLKFMPQETLAWRLQEWLTVGCQFVNQQLQQKKQQGGGEEPLQNVKVLVIAGEKDKTLPSIDEAERLMTVFPDCVAHVVEGAGHASTCGSRVDLAALARGRFPNLAPGRTSMKEEAASNTGVSFGMEKRYNGEEVGLSPLLYWSKDLYKECKR